MYDYDDYDDQDYTLADARADAAEEAWNALVQVELDRLVQPIMDRVEETDEEMPHPWTYERHLLSIWLEEGDDALREQLEEEHREEAEEAARENNEGPCCNDWHCPCGNNASPPTYTRGGKQYFY